jgi:FtsH-binding integral membrane protein
MNMSRQLDLVPYKKAPTTYPVEMTKEIEAVYDENTNKKIAESYTKLKLAKNREEVLQLLKEGYGYSGGNGLLVGIFFFWVATLWATLFFAASSISIMTGMLLFTMQSIAFGILLSFILLEMDENDGLRATKIVFLVAVLTGFIGYSDIYSFSENNVLQVILLLSLLGLIVFSLIRTFVGFSRNVIRIKAIFGAIVFSLFLLIDFNLIKKREGFSNDWDTAFEMAFIIYVDLMNLLLEILDAMSNN